MTLLPQAHDSLNDDFRTTVPDAHAHGARFGRGTIDTERGERILRLMPKFGAASIQVRLRYTLHGARGAPVVVALGGISAHRDVCSLEREGIEGWWDAIACRDGAIDPARFRILGIDWLDRADLGGAKAVDSSDQADALAALLDALGIARAHALVGSSYGAMVGLAFAARHPDRAERLVAISGAHRAHPMATALRAIQREIVRLGLASGTPDAALSLARQLAMTTYRGEDEFGLRFDAEPSWCDGRFQFPVERYLAAAGRKFVARFDPERFLALSESIDLHRIEPEAVSVPSTVIAITSDRLVPLADLIDLSERMAGPCRLETLDSRYGHDAFLKEPERIGALVEIALNTCCKGVAA